MCDVGTIDRRRPSVKHVHHLKLLRTLRKHSISSQNRILVHFTSRCESFWRNQARHAVVTNKLLSIRHLIQSPKSSVLRILPHKVSWRFDETSSRRFVEQRIQNIINTCLYLVYVCIAKFPSTDRLRPSLSKLPSPNSSSKKRCCKCPSIQIIQPATRLSPLSTQERLRLLLHTV